MVTLLVTLALAAGDVPLATPAQPAVQSLTLLDVLQSADELFPLITQARADVEVAEGDALSAAGGFDPAIKARAFHQPVGVSPYPQTRVDAVVEVPTPLWGASFFAGYRLGLGATGVTDIEPYYGERVTWSLGEVRAGAVVPLVRNGPIDRRRATLARAELGRLVAGLSVEQQRLEVARLATVRYWEWVAAGRRREVVRALLTIAEDRDTQLAARAEAGDVPVFDRQDNLRALVQRRAALVSAQREVEATAFQLSLYLRDGNGDPVLPPDERMPRGLPEPPDGLAAAASVEDAMGRRPDVLRLEQQKKQQQVELSLARNQLLPAVDVGVAVSQDLGQSPGMSFNRQSSPQLELSAAVEIPILYRAPLGRIQAATAALTRLDAQLRLARDRVAVEIRDSVSALGAAADRVQLTRQEVEVAQQLENGERSRFDLGDSSLLFVNIREQTTAEAKLKEVDALLDAQRAAASLRAALALPPVPSAG